MYINLHIQINIHIYIHMYIHIYIYIYVHIHIGSIQSTSEKEKGFFDEKNDQVRRFDVYLYVYL
jgi:hypothetical protein